MRQRDDMTFPMEEHERRLADLRQRMERQGLEVVIITDPENLFYLTEYQTTGYSYFQALVVPLEDEPFMVTRLLEETNVHARTWVDITRPYTDTGDAIETLWHALAEFDLTTKIIGYERNSYFFPAYQQDRMMATWYDAKFVDCFGLVEEGRIIKSQYELEVMRHAARAGQAGMAAGLAAVKEGATENDLAAEISAAMFRAGGEYPAVMPYITSGPRCMIGHATWEGRTIQSGDTVFIEVGGCYRRYHAAMMRTAFVGEPPQEVRDAEKLVLEALDNDDRHAPTGDHRLGRGPRGARDHLPLHRRRRPGHPRRLRHRHRVRALLGRGLHHEPQARRSPPAAGGHDLPPHPLALRLRGRAGDGHQRDRADHRRRMRAALGSRSRARRPELKRSRLPQHPESRWRTLNAFGTAVDGAHRVHGRPGTPTSDQSSCGVNAGGSLAGKDS